MKTQRHDWLIPAGLIVLSIVPAIGGGVRLASLGAEATADNVRFLAAPISITVHIVSVVLYSFLGALQFSPGFRKRNRWWHRVAGRVLLPAATMAALTGLWMTLTYPWPANDGVVVYAERLVVGTMMLWSIVMGVNALRRRQYAEHGEWMIRAYAVGLGAGTQVLTHLPWFIFVDLKPGVTPRAIMMGLGWLINIVVAEWVIRRPKLARRVSPVLAT
ncbi:MAG: DUF2306 domain-containing protein [Gemmatimonadaceae bacterium]|nr:DUF2306 domain-containing protein [Gemmatimonadaceae bacterium]